MKMMKSLVYFVLALSIMLISMDVVKAENNSPSWFDVKGEFETKILRQVDGPKPLAEPPAELFSLISYPTALGEMSGYLSKPKDKTKKLPAIVWILGGFPVGGAGSSLWTEQPWRNDRSAKSYRLNNIVTLYPALRGTFGNPGKEERFFGEINDVISARNYLAQLPYVDAEQIYLGGHSTGGTLVLLVAAASNQFKAAFSFGPTSDPNKYGDEYQLHDLSNPKERRMRAPINFLSSIQIPTFIIEGKNGNIGSMNDLIEKNNNPLVKIFPIEKAGHVDAVLPGNQLIAKQIANSTDPLSAFTLDAFQSAYDQFLATAKK